VSTLTLSLSRWRLPAHSPALRDEGRGEGWGEGAMILSSPPPSSSPLRGGGKFLSGEGGVEGGEKLLV